MEGEPSRRGQCKTVLTPITLLESLSDNHGATLSCLSASQRRERVGRKNSLFTAVLVPLESLIQPMYVLWVDMHQVRWNYGYALIMDIPRRHHLHIRQGRMRLPFPGANPATRGLEDQVFATC